MKSKHFQLVVGAVIALAGVAGAAGEAAAAPPSISSVSNDVEAGGMYQGRVLTIDIIGTSFGAQPGSVWVYDGKTGAYLFPLGPDSPLVTWTSTAITIVADQSFTQTYEPKLHAYTFEVHRSDNAVSNRKTTYFRVWSVPRQGDWSYTGPAAAGLLRGGAGAWDHRLNGMISPAAAVKLGNTFYLYYIGARGDRADGGPAYRALGVATSSDGVHFTKRGKIIDTARAGHDEEGVFSAAATVDGGKVVLYYSRCQEVSPGDVACSAYRATSTNGIDFGGHQQVFGAGDVMAAGNEVFPTGVVHDMGVWVVTYLWKTNRWHLGSAWGTSGTGGWTSGELIAPDASGGMANSPLVPLPGHHTLVMGVRTPQSWPDYRPGATVELHSATYLTGLAKLDFDYRFPGLIQQTTYFDPSTRTWYLYGLDYSHSESCGSQGQATCRRASGISVRTYTSR